MIAVPVLLAASLGLFEQSVGIGAPSRPGRARLAGKSLQVSGGGANMWALADAFHLVSRAAQGDVSLTVDVAFTNPGGNHHKKAGPIFRAGLDPDDAYADLVVHGDGLISLQYRQLKGGPTAEISTTIKAPATLRLERHGHLISAEVRPAGALAFQPIGALTIVLPDRIHAGLAVCSHDDRRLETAVFRNLEWRNDGAVDPKSRIVESTLEIIDIDTARRHIVRRAREHFEAPNWTPDGRTLIYNGGGRLYRIPVEGGEPVRIETGSLRLNNDHGLSPDGRTLAISGSESGPSQIFTVSVNGGIPKLVVAARPSYWHGWSPDGRTLVYCAQRNGEYDIYAVPAAGGGLPERRLTTAPGLDDGPDFSPDGQWIYINSERNGLMRIWRIRPDASVQELVSDGPPSADWFAHPSPDGRHLIYIAFEASVKGHPPNKDVQLRLLPIGGGQSRRLATLFGGQGTMNVPSWAPDSRRFAFVSYRLVAPAPVSPGRVTSAR